MARHISIQRSNIGRTGRRLGHDWGLHPAASPATAGWDVFFVEETSICRSAISRRTVGAVGLKWLDGNEVPAAWPNDDEDDVDSAAFGVKGRVSLIH